MAQDQMAFEQARMNPLMDLLLKTAPTAIGYRGLKAAVAAAGRIVRKQAKRNMPVDTGLLRQAIGQRTVGRPRKFTAATIIGARTGFKSRRRAKLQAAGSRKGSRQPSKYLHLIEFGTKPHKVYDLYLIDGGVAKLIREVDHPGTTGTMPLTKAVRGTQGAQKKAMAEAIRKTMKKAIAKSRRKRGGRRRRAR